MIDIQRNLISKLLHYPEDYHLVSGMLKPEMFDESLSGIFSVLSEWCLFKTEIDRSLLADEAKADPKFIRSIFLGPSVGSALEYANAIRRAYLSQFASNKFSDGIDALQAGEDPETVNEAITALIFEESMSTTHERRNDLTSALVACRDNFHKAISSGGLSGADTGYQDLNKMFGGWQPTDQIVLAGRPGMGKTTLCCNFILNIAKSGNPVAFVSLEMPKLQIIQLFVSIIAGISTEQIRTGRANEDEQKRVDVALDELAQMPIFLFDQLYEIGDISRKIIALNRKVGLTAVAYDYAQQIRTQKRSYNRADEIEEVSSKLKQLAKREGFTNIVLAQLNRGLESRTDKRPMMSDLKSSGALEQDADMVMLLYREAYYSQDEYDNTCEIIIAKNRHGRTGVLSRIFQDRKFLELGTPDPTYSIAESQPETEEIPF